MNRRAPARTGGLIRRLEALERATGPVAHPPALILAVDVADADRQIARIEATYPVGNSTLFVMIGADRPCDRRS